MNNPGELSPSSEGIVRRYPFVDGALLGICASMKPSPNNPGRSAVRSLLCYTLTEINRAYKKVALLDLRENPLPFFDGRLPWKYGDPNLDYATSCVKRASALLIGVPGYWSGVSGVFKNCIDVLCGPSYESTNPSTTPFYDKPTGLVVVGADQPSAAHAKDQAETILISAGARMVGSPVVVWNPRRVQLDEAELSRALILLGAELIRHAFASKRGLV